MLFVIEREWVDAGVALVPTMDVCLLMAFYGLCSSIRKRIFYFFLNLFQLLMRSLSQS